MTVLPIYFYYGVTGLITVITLENFCYCWFL